jgi:hypothetical protein
MMMRSMALALVLLAASASAAQPCNPLVALAAPDGPPADCVLLGVAGDFVILSKAGVSTAPPSVITGDMGVSPIAISAVTGFELTLDSTNNFATDSSNQVNGKIYAADLAPPTPSKMTTAILNMATAYVDAAGRACVATKPECVNYGTGILGSINVGDVNAPLTAGVYKWNTGVIISDDIYIDGESAAGPSDAVFIFEAAGTLQVGQGQSPVTINLLNGAQASNIFWQIAGAVTVSERSHFEGTLMSATAVAFLKGSSINGRILAGTAVTLDKATVTKA